MKKIILIVKREYLSRVKKKSFLMVTFLVPLLIMGVMALTVYLAVKQGGDKKKVEVVDESGWFVNNLVPSGTIDYSFTSNYAAASKSFSGSDYDYLLHIPADLQNIQLLGAKTPGMMTTSKIEEDLTKVAQAHRLKDAHIDSAVLASAQADINVAAKQIGEGGEKDAHVMAASAIGLLGALLIYFVLFLYGSQVMRGVIEEKVSRIAEVVISSVKPFQLMMGKIIGVGMVGLTQFVLWIVLTFMLYSTIGGPLAARKAEAMKQIAQTQHISAAASTAQSAPEGDIANFIAQAGSLPIVTIIVCFLFYFLFGYLLYSALFAAVGSAVDTETETQQFMLPITMPLVFTMVVAQSTILSNPDSPLAIWLSMIPFTSPIAMMIRIPFHVPAWQIACSMVLMVLGFLFTTWVAGRIYRVGILMYGKKASYKELAKWFRYKG